MENNQPANAKQGFKVIIVVLAAIIVAVSIFFFMNVNSLKEEAAILNQEKIALTSDLNSVKAELSTITTTNKALNASLEADKARIEELLAQIESEKASSKAEISRYQRELANVKALVKKYAAQIEELNEVNVKLVEENVQVKSDLKDTRAKVAAAKAESERLAAVVSKGKVIVAREIELVNVKANEKETERIRRAKKLKIDFTLVANQIATPGARTVYARLIGPDGYLLTSNTNATFAFNGQNIGYTASREVDYQNDDLKVSVYLDDVNRLDKGTYLVEVYMDGAVIGTKEIVTK